MLLLTIVYSPRLIIVSSKFVLTILYMSIICCSWDAASYDSLLGSNKLFSQPIPLNEMVDFLVEVWEQEGLYD
ncbi:hypothetical protein IGI04_032390 [Brassica rapa subsp. trilocularis]|uniref:Gag1-like clamp domain-containing protein n=1 Tax=Brassica rapa subsp. trilocularis TaxID=1813537 RepID=A0ABQ7LWB8_BRACM|nr:hypothetical protein IGI04_032390 [Brassica rapa subsp. trilocularis]